MGLFLSCRSFSFVNRAIMKHIFAFLLIACGYCSWAQPAIKFLETSSFMGVISPGNIPPAVFKFVNTGNKPLAILTIQADYEVKPLYQRSFVAPGDTGRIALSYESSRLGEFSKQITVNTNAPSPPVVLSLSGRVGSAIECMPNKQNRNVRQVMVIDKQTKEPINKARLSMLFNDSRTIQATTARDGKAQPEMPIGIYDFDISANGYRSLRENRFVTLSMGFLLFELDPLPRSPKPEPQPIPVARQDTPRPKPAEPIAPQPALPQDNALMPSSSYSPNNIVFLVDVSASMKQDKKMEMLKKAMKELTAVLRPIDRISLIGYNDSAFVIMPTTSGAETEQLKSSIDKLIPKGYTNGVKGLELAYTFAKKNRIAGGNNEIILATDGEFTGARQSGSSLKEMIGGNAEQGILLSIVGFGGEQASISKLKSMASSGKGEYLHISPESNNTELLIENIKKHSLKEKR